MNIYLCFISANKHVCLYFIDTVNLNVLRLELKNQTDTSAAAKGVLWDNWSVEQKLIAGFFLFLALLSTYHAENFNPLGFLPSEKYRCSCGAEVFGRFLIIGIQALLSIKC